MEKAIESANKVLDSQSHKLLPHWVLKNCKGVAVVTYDEVAFAFSVGAGDGVLLKHNNEDGSWSPPTAISVNVLGLGLIFGAASKQILLYPMSDKCLNALLETNKVQLGASLGLAAGPIGREADVGVNTKTGDVTYAYVHEKGAFVSAGINGSVITHETKANHDFYGCEASPVDICAKPGAVTVPPNKGVEELHQKLADMTK